MNSRDEDVVDYLLGELPADEVGRMEQALREDADLRIEVERLRPLVADLEALPEEAWGDDSDIPALPDLPPISALSPPADLAARRAARQLSLRPLAAVAASFIVLALGIAIGAVVTNRGADTGPPIALERFGEADPSASGTARVVASDGAMRLRVSGLAPSESDQFYELWLLDGPRQAVSLGSFRVPASGTANLTVPLPFPLTAYRFIDVSIEPADGVATHSGRSVLRAPTTA